MSIEVKVPSSLNESPYTTFIVTWLKKEGEGVQAGEKLLELEMTDKVVLEIPAPVSGLLTKIIVAQGESVLAGDILATIDENTHDKNEIPPPLPRNNKTSVEGYTNQSTTCERCGGQMEITTTGILMDKILKCTYCDHTVDVPDAFSTVVNEREYYTDTSGNRIKLKTTRFKSRIDGLVDSKDISRLFDTLPENGDAHFTNVYKTIPTSKYGEKTYLEKSIVEKPIILKEISGSKHNKYHLIIAFVIIGLFILSMLGATN